MKKTLITVFISLLMIVSLLTPHTAITLNAQEEPVDVSKSLTTVKTAINDLRNVVSMSPGEIASLQGDFDDLIGAFKSIGGIISPINGTITFLRMIGMMKDPTGSALINIQTQLRDVSEKLTNMDQKLDRITEAMATMQATEEFHYRATKAKQDYNSWLGFRHDYMEETLNKSMNNYETSLRLAWQNWFDSDNGAQPDSDNVLIWYKFNANDGSGYKLETTLMNDFDPVNSRDSTHQDPYILYADEFDVTKDRLIALKNDFFTDARKIHFDINTYRNDLKEYTKNKIREELAKESSSNVRVLNLDATAIESSLEEIVDQAVDMIAYKFSYKYINSQEGISKTVLSQYSDYCSHLLTDSQGIKALLSAMYSTHAFEFEIKEDLLNAINMMILQTGAYSSFVANIISDSTIISNEEKDNFTRQMCKTLDVLAELKKNAITGEDRYCYLTNSIIDYGRIELQTEASIDWNERMANTTYKGCNGGSISAHVHDSSDHDQDTSNLVGDTAALLISYVVRSNGQTFNHDYMNEHLTVNKQYDKNGLVTSYNGEQSLVHDTNVQMATRNVIGSYFKGDPDIYLNSLPGKAEYGYVNIRRMGSGTLFDAASSHLNVNRPLIATAVYGESETMWFTDEAALMYGPKDTGTLSTAFKKDTTYEDTFLTEYRTTMYESLEYNALLSLQLKNNDAINNIPLNTYYSELDSAIINKDIDHQHVWDEGTIIRTVTDTVPGLIEYHCTAEDDYDAYSYTKLYYNKQLAKLTFNLEGGKLDGYEDKLTREFNIGSVIYLPKEPEKKGYTFQYWDTSDYPASSSYEVKQDKTFTAVYTLSKEYQLDKKTDTEWNNGSRIAPYIRVYRVEDSDATLSHFKEVRLNGVTVNEKNYEVENGSLILKFHTGYLKSLPTGVHLVEILFDDGKVEFMLNIKNQPADPSKEYKIPVTGIK